MLETLPLGEKEDLRSAALFISGLPPLELFEKMMRIQATDPQQAEYIFSSFKWLGMSLDAFFSDASDPLPNSGLSEVTQSHIRDNSYTYIIFSTLIFQGEKFLKQEALAAGIDWPFKTRSSLLATLAYEDCLFEVYLSLENHWESLSEAQRNERLRDSQQYLRGELSESSHQRQKERWRREDVKLHRDFTSLSVKTQFWKPFCLSVFQKYKDRLPAFDALVETLGIPKEEHGKFTIVNGRGMANPVRGRSKRKRS